MNWSALLFLLAVPLAMYAGAKPADVMLVAIVAAALAVGMSGVLF